jgi:hypothetical protein
VANEITVLPCNGLHFNPGVGNVTGLWVDKIVPPGLTINLAGHGWGSPALQAGPPRLATAGHGWPRLATAEGNQ